ncbi:MAG: aldehyde dehydrogenase family protein [Microbacteriaceae bacterium]|nr:aldehyde dehydrogenase family protein [Microbacteriaceae bacterium]
MTEGDVVRGTDQGAAFEASFDPSTGEQRGSIAHSSPADVAASLARTLFAGRMLAASSPSERREWLFAVAAQLVEHQDELVELAQQETALGVVRLRGELLKAAVSMRFYADVAVEGSYLGASIETIDATTTLSRWNIALGPVAVFGASNFPFGFGLIGHDVASALSVGCPVVSKAHPAHPRLSVRLAEITQNALATSGAPQGSYELVVGFAAGIQLIDAPEITAVAFTGSQAGGMAILQRAAARGIPVFAEMGTVNPVVVTPLAGRDSVSIAAGFVASFTLGVGQFCTKPGLLFAPAGMGFAEEVEHQLGAVAAFPLLTAGIAHSYRRGISEVQDAAGIRFTAPSETELPGFAVAAHVIRVRPEDLRTGSRLLEECFGPMALVCEYDDIDQVFAALAQLQPALAASVFTGLPDASLDSDDADPDGTELVRRMLPLVGRLAVNSWPTGVATSWSQQHGGPWPATSRTEATSVGAGALARFVRPVSLQNAAPAHLPLALHPHNPWGIPRRIDGILTLPSN